MRGQLFLNIWLCKGVGFIYIKRLKLHEMLVNLEVVYIKMRDVEPSHPPPPPPPPLDSQLTRSSIDASQSKPAVAILFSNIVQGASKLKSHV